MSGKKLNIIYIKELRSISLHGKSKEMEEIFKIRKHKNILLFIMISLLLQCNTNTTIVNMRSHFLSHPNSFNFISLKPCGPMKKKK